MIIDEEIFDESLCILEARRGNYPRKPISQILLDFKDDERAFISFRDVIETEKYVPKKSPFKLDYGLSINPNNVYDTPTGIYGYPIKNPIGILYIQNPYRLQKIVLRFIYIGLKIMFLLCIHQNTRM